MLKSLCNKLVLNRMYITYVIVARKMYNIKYVCFICFRDPFGLRLCALSDKVSCGQIIFAKSCLDCSLPFSWHHINYHHLCLFAIISMSLQCGPRFVHSMALPQFIFGNNLLRLHHKTYKVTCVKSTHTLAYALSLYASEWMLQFVTRIYRLGPPIYDVLILGLWNPIDFDLTVFSQSQFALEGLNSCCCCCCCCQ
jgi:hypothetical protein